MNVDFKLDEQTIQMSIVVLTGVKTHFQSRGHSLEWEGGREVGGGGDGGYRFVTRSAFGSLHWALNSLCSPGWHGTQNPASSS